MIKTAGNWDPTDRHIYFLAGSYAPIARHQFILQAVNELNSARALNTFDRLIGEGKRVLLDSGIFWLTNAHMRKHGMSMNDALALPPEEIDGFDELWDRYLALVQRFGNDVWGYIELDQGGMDNKRKTRAKLNDLGLRPMPVYHPLNDGWDYFDELATTHDRLCFGNVVQAETTTRLRFLHTLWERHRAYPDLWVHVLGLTPNQFLNALPVDSADSSTWLSAVRWDGMNERAMLKALSKMDPEFKYVLGDTSYDSLSSDKRALAMSDLSMMFMQRGWRHWEDRMRDEFDLPAYPLPTLG